MPPIQRCFPIYFGRPLQRNVPDAARTAAHGNGRTPVKPSKFPQQDLEKLRRFDIVRMVIQGSIAGVVRYLLDALFSSLT